MFNFEENDRDKKELKKDFKKIEKKHNGKVKIKHLIGTIFISFFRLLSNILREFFRSSRCY